MGDSSETVTINANKTGGAGSDTETITIGTDGIGTGDEIGAVGLTAADGVTLTGNITLANTDGATLTVTGPAKIDGTVVIDTDNDDEDGTIEFTSTIDGVDNLTADSLTIHAGSSGGDPDPGGSLTLSGAIGSLQHLDTLNINATSGNITLSIPQIGAGGSAGVSGDTTIGNTGSGDITFTAGGANAYNLSLIHI